MRLLLDENLSPRLCPLLAHEGHDAVHVRDLGLQSSRDEEIFDRAACDGAVLVTEDTDFGRILFRRRARTPSMILFRSADPLTPEQQADLLLPELVRSEHALTEGGILILSRGRVRFRQLPLGDS